MHDSHSVEGKEGKDTDAVASTPPQRPSSPVRGVDFVALALVAATASLLLLEIWDYALVGWDSIPQIASARIDSWDAFLGSFTEQMGEGYFPYGAFYRPVFNLSVALNHALSGLDPSSYHVVNTLLFAAAAIATYVLARRLLGEATVAGPIAALVTFLSLSVHVEAAGVLSRRADVILGLLIALVLATQIRRVDQPMPRGALLPALFTFLAAATKGTAVILPPLMFATVLLATSKGGLDRWRHAAVAMLVHGIAAGSVIVARFLAIGGMGGVALARPEGAVIRLPDMLGGMLLRLGPLPPGVEVPAAWVWGVALAAIAATGAISLTLLVRGATGGAATPGDRLLQAAGITLCWMTLSAGLYGVHGLLQPWYLFAPGQAFAILVGAGFQGLANAARSRRQGIRLASGVCLALLCGWLVWKARYSPFYHHYGHWERASQVMSTYLAALEERIDGASDGDVIRIAAPPPIAHVDPKQSLGRRGWGLKTYTVQAWVDVRYPDRLVEVREHRPGAADRTPRPDGLVVVLERRRSGH